MSTETLDLDVEQVNGTNVHNTPQVGWSTAKPVTGLWCRGDRIYNQAPAAGQPAGWICVASGNPGTWVDMPETVG